MGFSGGGGGVSQEQAAILNIALNMFLQEAIFRQKGTYTGYDNLFSDNLTTAAGANGTINTGSPTTAHFISNKYANGGATGTTETYTGSDTNTQGTVTSLTMNFTAKTYGYMSAVLINFNNTSGTVTLSIVQNGVTLASKSFSGSGVYTCSFASTDYSGMLSPSVASGAFQITATATTGSFNTQGSLSFSGTTWSCSSQTMIATQISGTAYTYTFTQQFPYTNTIIQTNALSVPANTQNPNYFLVYPNYTVTGTGNVTFDVSFDGGSTWMIGVSINKPVAISTTNTNSIECRINLNAGASSGSATCDAWGIAFC